MDPKECLRLLRVCLVDRQWDDALVYAEALADWCDRGGFVPANMNTIIPERCPHRLRGYLMRLNAMAGAIR